MGGRANISINVSEHGLTAHYPMSVNDMERNCEQEEGGELAQSGRIGSV